MNARPSGIIQKPKIGRNPKKPPITNSTPISARTPRGSLARAQAVPRCSLRTAWAFRLGRHDELDDRTYLEFSYHWARTILS